MRFISIVRCYYPEKNSMYFVSPETKVRLLFLNQFKLISVFLLKKNTQVIRFLRTFIQFNLISIALH